MNASAGIQKHRSFHPHDVAMSVRTFMGPRWHHAQELQMILLTASVAAASVAEGRVLSAQRIHKPHFPVEGVDWIAARS